MTWYSVHSQGQAVRATTARWGAQEAAVEEDTRGSRRRGPLLPSCQQAAGERTGGDGDEVGVHVLLPQALDSGSCCAGPSVGRARQRRDEKMHGVTGGDGGQRAMRAQRAQGERGGAIDGGGGAEASRPSRRAGSRPQSGPSCPQPRLRCSPPRPR